MTYLLLFVLMLIFLQDHYARTIQKSIENSHCDLSICVDAAGTAVMGHGLYFKENVVVGQPPLFTCLKASLKYLFYLHYNLCLFRQRTHL